MVINSFRKVVLLDIDKTRRMEMKNALEKRAFFCNYLIVINKLRLFLQLFRDTISMGMTMDARLGVRTDGP